MTPEQLTEARKIAAISAPGNGIALLVAHIDAQAAEIERLRDELALCCQLKREYQEQAK